MICRYLNNSMFHKVLFFFIMFCTCCASYIYLHNELLNNMATIKAFIRTTQKGNVLCNVRFRLTDGRNIQFFATSNLSVNLNDWDSKNEKIKAKVLYDNSKRKDFDNAILEHKQYIIDNYTIAGNNLPSNWLEKLLDKKYHPDKYKIKTNETFFSLLECFIEQQEMSIIRRKHYYVVYRSLKRFEKYKYLTLTIHQFNESTLLEYKEFLEKEYSKVSKRPDIYKDMKSTEVPKKRSDNTIIGIIKKIRTFYNWLIKTEKTTNDPFKNYAIGTATYGTPVYLTKNERDKIAGFNFQFQPKFEIQRDIFIFQCLVGCRVGDLMKFTKENIDNNILSYIPSKTAKNLPKTVEVPLSENAIKLIVKYKENKGKALFPFISPQKYNDAIRNIFTLAGITRVITWYNPQTKQGEQKQLNEIASSHIARRTFIGNLYSNLKDPNLIGSMSGHVEGSKAINRYRDINIDIKKEIVSKYMD